MALDITLDAAEVAIVPNGTQPTDSDWVAAEWVRAAPTQQLPGTNRLTTDYWFLKVTGTVDNATDFAYLRVLVGPTGAVALPADPAKKVDVWSRIHDDPETPVQKHASAVPIS
ncbi:hypothetical protein [Segeticoccus rhizosphaerae]|uniref:hypothetical protein n=1 Tax=Segeticoccus rhizosphaerae TaxID=1104777 RepID=UPI001264E6C2|nr:hypothetical protein [Segeticoccus rhizosphaerae]